MDPSESTRGLAASVARLRQLLRALGYFRPDAGRTALSLCLLLLYHHKTEAGDIIFRAGTDTCAFQILFQQGLLIFISAIGTLLFMAVAMARLNRLLTAVALVAVPILLLSIKLFGHAMRGRG